jgi:SPP1 gp7 family putative phage head morphogenesis protein
MATPAGGTPIAPGIIQRITGGLKLMITGNAPAWFGPNDPLPPQAPEDVKGRPFDFPVGVNLQYQPRKELGTDVDFATLRRVADPAQGGLDLVRGAIETRKDQMEALKWSIRGKDGQDAKDRAQLMMTALRKPDLVHTFRQWQRMLLEDLFVIDAPAIYKRPMAEGFRIPEPMDGATIKILVDQNGRRPMPPDPAFQQIIKGLPANDYTLDELIYAPRNLRTHKFYGMSPVEQVLGIISLGLNRQLHLISYYTAGNVPDQLIATPEAWNPDQIKQAQQWLDSVLEGNVQAKRKMILVPGGMEPKPLKDPKLKDELDEWIARIVCWVFSLPPSALVKEVNRATAQTAQQSSASEGLEPLKLWWKDIMDQVILECFGADDLEFAWEDEEISDPTVKVTYWTGFKNAGIVTADEVRDRALGLPPLTDEQKEELKPPAPLGGLFGGGGDELEGPGAGKPGKKPGDSQGGDRDSASGLPPAKDGEGTAKLEKKKRLAPINRNRPAVRRAVKAMKAAAATYFTATRKAVLGEVTKLAKADLTHEQIQAILAALSDEERPAFIKALQAAMGTMATDGAEQALAQVIEFLNVPEDALDSMLSQANDRAIAWAQDRAAELVTLIDETTRASLNDLVGQALQEGWSNDELAAQIEDGETFGPYRAEMIARTETAFADVQGNLAGWRESGVVDSKQWVVAQDEVCDDCLALDGQVVGLDGSFPGGDPPLHPNCFLPGTVVSAAGVTRHLERWFEGEIVRVLIEGQDPLAVTPNHPILTRRGWVPAGQLEEGEDVFLVTDPGAFVRVCDPQDHHMQARIEEVADALLVAGGVPAVSVPVAAEHFHGDGSPGQEVRIVGANRGLDLAPDPGSMEQPMQPKLMLTDADLERFAGGCYAGSVFEAVGLPTDGLMGLGGPGAPGVSAGPGSLDLVGLASIPDGQAGLAPCLAEGAAVASQRTRQIHAALAGLVSPVKVQKLVRGEKWAGHVYNLETVGGWYVAGSIITHNCRCDLLPVLTSTPEED